MTEEGEGYTKKSLTNWIAGHKFAMDNGIPLSAEAYKKKSSLTVKFLKNFVLERIDLGWDLSDINNYVTAKTIPNFAGTGAIIKGKLTVVGPVWEKAVKYWYALHYTALHYPTLHYTTLHYTTPHYTPLHPTTLHYTALHYTRLHCTILRYTTLHFTTLHYATLNYTTLHYTTLHYTTLHYIALHYTTLRYATLHCITLLYTSLHYTAKYYYTTYTLHYFLHNLLVRM